MMRSKKNRNKSVIKPLSLRENEMITKLKTSGGINNKKLFEQRILSLQSEILKFINKEMISDDNVSLILHIMSRVCESENNSLLGMIPKLMDSAMIMKQISFYLLKWTTDKDKQFCWSIAVCLLAIFEKCAKTYPTTMYGVSLDSLKNFVSYLGDNALKKKMDKILLYKYAISTQSFTFNSDSKQIVTRKNEIYVNMMPNDDFRRLSTIPTQHDLEVNQEIPLRPLKTKDGYASGEEYLDTHYRLIREDLLAPLRERIAEIKVQRYYEGLDLFQGVQILYPLCSYRGVTYKVSFDNERFRGFPWEYSRKLIFGSLLCFTRDSFETVIFGTVADRTPRSLSQGYLDVRFPDNRELHEYTKYYKYFKMIECPSFFEAYRHVMDCFKEINPYALPFSRYIVNCGTDMKPPQYLRNQPFATYDLTEALGNMSAKAITLPVNKLTSQWNVATDLNFSQLYALRHALTSEFAIIQGPPGTGKTFTGLRIAHCLLVNKQLWNSQEDTPMLVVCYTNHALDQFMQGLINYGHEKIIRVGGRLCEEMQQYSLKEAVQKFRGTARRNGTHQYIRYIRTITHETRDKLAEELGPYMKSVKKYKEAVKRGKLVLYSDIQHCMLKKHANYFMEQEQHCTTLKISIFDIFLDLCKIPMSILHNVSQIECSSNEKRDTVTRVSCKYKANETSSNEEDLIDVFGEGNALIDRWVIDENEYKPIEVEEEIENSEESIDSKSMFVDEDGFKLVTMSRREKENKVRRQLNDVDAMSEEEVDGVENPWKLTVGDRWRLYKYWLNIFIKNYDDFVELRMQQYEDACEAAYQVTENEHELILRSADVIAMTTTCAGRYRHVLRNIQPKVVVIEEAAEVLEAHVISSLVKETQHCILIGDHQQLRPNPSVYNLANDFNLDLSLFERMVRINMECPTLNIQHRMRPQISLPLRHIYPELRDHESVTKYEIIKGVQHNMFFINHSNPERSIGKFKSKANLHEAQFIKSLCLYFLQQGYDPGQITVLTGYSGQLMELRSLMPRDIFEGVKVTCVDNFQGEENDIILLSLVRSNPRGIIGFLKTENRVCVSLSRAKKGFYVIGNFDLLASQCPLWNSIIEDVKAQGCFGTTLSLVCQNHPDTVVEVSSAKDFDLAPEGGCEKICGYYLACGHTCEAYCHPYDLEHKEYVCHNLCLQSSCELPEHVCEVRCHYGAPCPPCVIPVERKFQICGHTCAIPCSNNPEETSCPAPCDNTLSCGHTCPNRCGEKCLAREMCVAEVDKTLPCGHTQNVECNKNVKDAVCENKCGTQLECGHICQGSCARCFRGSFHIKCEQDCLNQLTCLHSCTGKCGQECRPCQRISCVAKDESNIVDQSNTHCTNHREKSVLIPGNPCDERCEFTLRCKHRCSSSCGEKCFCMICVYQLNDQKEYDQDEICVLLDCGHYFPVPIIDDIFVDNYNEPLQHLILPGCPKCGTMIRKVKRYQYYITQFKDDIRKVEQFKIKQTSNQVTKIANKAYEMCQTLAEKLNECLKKKIYLLGISEYHRKDLASIVKADSLDEFRKGLDLRYLVRSLSKSWVLLLVERLIQCRTSLVEVYRIYNQAVLLKYMYKVFALLKEVGSLDGQEIALHNELNDILRRSMNYDLSLQQCQDLMLRAEVTFLRLQLILCRRSIKSNLRSKRGFIQTGQALAIIKSLLKIIREKTVDEETYSSMIPVIFTLSQKFSFKIANSGRLKIVGSTYEKTLREWFKCSKRHLFSPTSKIDDVTCPLCEKYDLSESSQSSSGYVSLRASNNEYDSSNLSYELTSSPDSISPDDLTENDKSYMNMRNKKVDVNDLATVVNQKLKIQHP